MPEILAKIPVIFFNGNFDFTVPLTTTNNWLNKLKWPGQEQFSTTPRTVWTDQGGNTIGKRMKKQHKCRKNAKFTKYVLILGYYRGYGHLTQVIVALAGHVVIQDQTQGNKKKKKIKSKSHSKPSNSSISFS